MNCSQCNQVIGPVAGQDIVACENCGHLEFAAEMATTIDGVVLSDQRTSFACPACCDQLLVVGTIDQCQLAACPECHGFVIDSASLGHLISHRRAAYRGADDRPVPMNQRALDVRRACPACGQTMQVHPYHGPGNSVIDSCPCCQLTWMDRGELDRIIRAPGVRNPGGSVVSGAFVQTFYNHQTT